MKIQRRKKIKIIGDEVLTMELVAAPQRTTWMENWCVSQPVRRPEKLPQAKRQAIFDVRIEGADLAVVMDPPRKSLTRESGAVQEGPSAGFPTGTGCKLQVFGPQHDPPAGRDH